MNPIEILATVMLFASGEGWPDLSKSIQQELALVVMQQIRADHIAANVPPNSRFHEYLERDIRAFLVQRAQEDVQFSVDLLRTPPTQVGVAFPKYYVWIEASSPTQGDLSGAARVAAVNGREFSIQEFITRRDINAQPDALYRTFPASLVPHIAEQARGRIRNCLP
jgi:hypothetical protein